MLQYAEDKVSLEVDNPFLKAAFWIINLLVYKVRSHNTQQAPACLAAAGVQRCRFACDQQGS